MSKAKTAGEKATASAESALAARPDGATKDRAGVTECSRIARPRVPALLTLWSSPCVRSATFSPPTRLGLSS